MQPSTPLSNPSPNRLLVLAEIGLVFLVFFAHAAWPTPHVNEAHYLCKAIHFWNPQWAPHDFFLNSSDTHFAFYLGFGWLSLFVSPVVLAWIGRVATWWLLAWAWRRLNWAVLGQAWWSIVTGAVALFLIDHFQMAGEWLVGGVEAKGFAYVLVLLGLEQLVRNHWNRVWLCFGGAAMLHVLVGGWAVAAGGLAWVLSPRESRATLRSMWPGLMGGFLLSLPGLVPSLLLGSGVDPETVNRAYQIQVFVRLKHHLNPTKFPSHEILRFALLLMVWLFVRWKTHESHPAERLHGFVAGSVVLSMTGLAISYATMGHPEWTAALLRFYWFRLADVMVPIGVALGALVLANQIRWSRAALARAMTAGLVLLAVWQVGSSTAQQTVFRRLFVSGLEKEHLDDWRDACRWIANSGRIPREAIFLTPRTCRTFKWYSAHAEVINCKDMPQDPPSVVEWWSRLNAVHATGYDPPMDQWFESLAVQGKERLRWLGRRYQADYVLTVTEPRLDLPVEYENQSFIIYRLTDRLDTPPRSP